MSRLVGGFSTDGLIHSFIYSFIHSRSISAYTPGMGGVRRVTIISNHSIYLLIHSFMCLSIHLLYSAVFDQKHVKSFI